MNATMLEEIAAQPTTLERSMTPLREALRSLDLTPSRVIAGGCGDSYYAAVALSGLYHRLGLPFVSGTSQDIAHFNEVGPDDLVVLISVSGGTRRTVEAAQVAKQQGAQTLAITCNFESDLARKCQLTCLLPYRPISRKTPHTLDYSMSLLALTLLAENLSKETFNELAALPDEMSLMIARAKAVVKDVLGTVRSSTKFFFLGAGPQRGTAMYAAAKYYEAGGLTAFHEETENFVHGMNFMLEPYDVVTLFASNARTLARVHELTPGLLDLGAHVLTVTSEPVDQAYHLPLKSLPLVHRPLLEVVAPQLLCLETANRLGLALEQPRAGRPNGHKHLEVQNTWMKKTAIESF